jgi:hypothetical protein
VVYAIIGLFGAARYGAQTSDNILENKWMGGGIGQGILNLSISCMSNSCGLYFSLSSSKIFHRLPYFSMCEKHQQIQTISRSGCIA